MNNFYIFVILSIFNLWFFDIIFHSSLSIYFRASSISFQSSYLLSVSLYSSYFSGTLYMLLLLDSVWGLLFIFIFVRPWITLSAFSSISASSFVVSGYLKNSGSFLNEGWCWNQNAFGSPFFLISSRGEGISLKFLSIFGNGLNLIIFPVSDSSCETDDEDDWCSYGICAMIDTAGAYYWFWELACFWINDWINAAEAGLLKIIFSGSA